MALSTMLPSDMITCTFWLVLSLQLTILGRTFLQKTSKHWDSISPALQTHIVVRSSYLPAQIFYIFSTYRALFSSDEAIASNIDGICSSVLTAWLVCSTNYLYTTLIITKTLPDFFHHLATIGLTLWYYMYSQTWGPNIDTDFVREAAVVCFCSMGICSIILTLLFLLRTLFKPTQLPLFKCYASSTLTWTMCLVRVTEWAYHAYFLCNRTLLAVTLAQRLVIGVVILAAIGLCRLHWIWAVRCYKTQARLWAEYSSREAENKHVGLRRAELGPLEVELCDISGTSSACK